MIFLELTDEVLPVNYGGVMLPYRNIWDGTEIAKAWGYNAEIGVECMPRVRADGADDAFAFLVMRPYSDRIARWADGSFLGSVSAPAGRSGTSL